MAIGKNIALLRQRRGQSGYGFMSLFKMNGLTEGEQIATRREAEAQRMGWQTTLPDDTFVLVFTDHLSNREVMNTDGFRGQLDFVR